MNKTLPPRSHLTLSSFSPMDLNTLRTYCTQGLISRKDGDNGSTAVEGGAQTDQVKLVGKGGSANPKDFEAAGSTTNMKDTKGVNASADVIKGNDIEVRVRRTVRWCGTSYVSARSGVISDISPHVVLCLRNSSLAINCRKRFRHTRNHN